MIGAEKTGIPELPRIADRISFIYLERCRVSRNDSGILVETKIGSYNLPVASVCSLLLGPGTTITHRAMELIGDSGTTVVWVGERGARYYAHGRPLTHTSTLLEAQASLTSNRRSRLRVARRMYQMRFPGEDVSHLTMQQLRGREGARIRRAYREWSEMTGVEWNGRNYDPEDYSSGDAVNKALSTANACLYGLVHGVIVSMGCSPGLGFIHTGHERSFVYDIADLYKTETSIPVAFKVASLQNEDVSGTTRRAMRDSFSDGALTERIAHDVKNLLLESEVDDDLSTDSLSIWGDGTLLPSGTNYSEDGET